MTDKRKEKRVEEVKKSIEEKFVQAKQLRVAFLQKRNELKTMIFWDKFFGERLIKLTARLETLKGFDEKLDMEHQIAQLQNTLNVNKLNMGMIKENMLDVIGEKTDFNKFQKEVDEYYAKLDKVAEGWDI